MKWQPIDTANSDIDDQEVLLWIPDLGPRPAYRNHYGEWISPVDIDCIYGDATHWMPMPKPPKG